jgi:hypothetical protein
MRFLALCLALVASTAFAQPQAVIQGPGESIVGDLVVLNSGASVGDNKVWIVDPAASGRTIECAETLAFAVGTPGRYEFTLVVANKEAEIAFARHVVIVRVQGTTPPPVDPVDPVDPDPTDPPPVVPPNLKELTELSKSRAISLADNATANALADALKAAVAQSGPKPLADAKTAISAAFESTMLARTGASRDKDWLRTWRVPINEAIDKLNPTTTAQYLAAVTAVEQGLRTTGVSVQSAKIVMYSRPGCVYCDRWERLVMPQLLDAGWIIEKAFEPTGDVPKFQVCAYGKCAEHTGYMDMNLFIRIVDSLKK